MRSDRKSAANRRNSCKSCGPRTAAGKAIASRNALKHGLSAVVYRQPEFFLRHRAVGYGYLRQRWKCGLA